MTKDIVFQTSRFDILAVQVPIKGKGSVTRHLVAHPGAVAILPILDKEHIILIRNRRFAVNEVLWELPAGTREKGEDPMDTAKRELIEEAGYKAHKMTFLTRFYTTPGFSNEMMEVYVAEDLEEVGQSLQGTEEIDVHVVTWNKALDMCREGVIKDGKTVAALFFYKNFFI